MTTKKNLVKSMFMSILTAGIFGFGFTACSDDLNELGNAQPVPEISGGSRALENMEQWSYTVPVEINCEGPWKIEFNFDNDEHHFCYALPDHGDGPATVKICVLDNWSDKRNSGEMIITNLMDTSKSTTLKLAQKCNLDNPSIMRAMTRGFNGEAEMNGDIKFAVGYGYNVSLEPGTKSVTNCPIIAIEKLAAAGNDYGRRWTGVNGTISSNVYAASSIYEVTKKMEASSKISGSYAGFSAEAGASFSNTQKLSTNSTFVLATHDVTVRNVELVGLNRDNFREYMTDDAKRAIDGKSPAYPSNELGFKRLIEDYGTHLIVGAEMGGRLRYATTVDKSLASTETDAKAYAKASYKNKVVEGEGSVSVEMKKKYEQNKSKVMTNVKAVGGDYSIACQIDGENKDSDTLIADWKKSLGDYQNLMVVGNENKLWPLYELIDVSTAEGQERAQRLKEYIETGLAGAVTKGEQIDITAISIPADWGTKDEYGKPLHVCQEFHERSAQIDEYVKANSNTASSSLHTLVKEAVVNGKVVAQICNEYIPAISVEERVTVIYPVKSGKANYSMGRFVGSDKYYACNVSWNDNGTVNLSSYASKKGANYTYYLRDMKFFAASELTFNLGNVEIVNAQVRDKYLDGVMNIMGVFVDYKYPLVKLANKIWCRQDYSGKVSGNSLDGHWMHTFYTDCAAANDKNFPTGWKAPSTADFEAVKRLLESEGSNTPQNELIMKGKTGLDLQYVGRVWWGKRISHGGIFSWHDTAYYLPDNNVITYWTSDKKYVYIEKDKSFEIRNNNKIFDKANDVVPNKKCSVKSVSNQFYCFTVRLVAE